MATHWDDKQELDFEQPPGRWDFLFSWTGLFLLGWVLYELTSQAFLGVTLFCCKLGWEDFRTALWLRHKDPVPARGKMELWIFIASGLWRTAITAIVIMIVLAVLAAKLNVPEPDELGEAALTALIGFSISFLTTLRALVLAVWHGRKLWLHPTIHESRRHNLWPPLPNAADAVSRRDLFGKNKAGTLIIFSVTTFSYIVAILTIFSLLRFLGHGNQILLFMFFMFFGYPVIVLWIRDYQRRHILAQYPEECWGQDAIAEE